MCSSKCRASDRRRRKNRTTNRASTCTITMMSNGEAMHTRVEKVYFYFNFIIYFSAAEMGCFKSSPPLRYYLRLFNCVYLCLSSSTILIDVCVHRPRHICIHTFNGALVFPKVPNGINAVNTQCGKPSSKSRQKIVSQQNSAAAPIRWACSKW